MTLYVEDSFVYIHFFSNFMPFVLAARRKSGEDIGIDVLYVISKI